MHMQMPQKSCANQEEKAFAKEKKNSKETKIQEKGQEEKDRQEV